jgi:putative N-acetyltransferase (TIGR04045 family)
MARVAVISPFSAPAEAAEALARSLDISCLAAAGPDQVAIHHEIRRRVFVEEQAFFEGSDRDDHDEDPATIRVLGLVGPVAGGAVRLYPLDEEGEWKGDRLAVLPEFRKHGLGAPLVRFAVRTAGELGGRRMVAHIQPPNVLFFERLGWYRLGEPADYVGHLHQKMAIDLRPAR